MTPNPQNPGSARSADDLNQQIRALWIRAAGRTLTTAEPALYEELRTAWAAAVRAGIVTAA